MITQCTYSSTRNVEMWDLISEAHIQEVGVLCLSIQMQGSMPLVYVQHLSSIPKPDSHNYIQLLLIAYAYHNQEFHQDKHR